MRKVIRNRQVASSTLALGSSFHPSTTWVEGLSQPNISLVPARTAR